MSVFIQPGKTTQDRRTIMSADNAGSYGTTFLGVGGIHASAELAIESIFSETIALAVSDETTSITTGASKITFRIQKGLTISSVRASVTTAPTGSSIIIDINKNGSSILSTKLSIDVSEETSITASSQPVISDHSLVIDDEISIDIDQIGSGTAGTGVKVYLNCIYE